MPSVLFVCTGNLHRSPMAEFLFKNKLEDPSDWRITSAGTYTRNGLPTSREVLTVLETYGINATSHRTKIITEALIQDHNLVLCLASNHKEALRAEFPDIEYEIVAREIDQYLTHGFERILELSED